MEQRYVFYNSTIGYQYFTVDEKSSSELDKYIQIRSVVDTEVALVVPRNEVREPNDKELESINKILRNKEENKNKVVEVKIPARKSGMYSRFTGADLKNIMQQNKVGYRKLAKYAGYAPSTIQAAVYRENRPVTKKLWNRCLIGIKKIRDEENAKNGQKSKTIKRGTA